MVGTRLEPLRPWCIISSYSCLNQVHLRKDVLASHCQHDAVMNLASDDVPCNLALLQGSGSEWLLADSFRAADAKSDSCGAAAAAYGSIRQQVLQEKESGRTSTAGSDLLQASASDKLLVAMPGVLDFQQNATCSDA